MSDSSWSCELQHTRPPCPSPSSRVGSNTCPLSQWYHPTISSSVTPFSFRPQSFPPLESFPRSRLFTSGGQSFRASASELPMNIQGWCLLGLTGWISLLSKGLSRIFSSTTVWEKHNTQLKIKTKQQSGSAQHRWPPTILIPDDWFLFSSSNVQTGHLVSRTNLDTTPPFWTLPGPIRRRVRITLSYFRFHVCLVTVAFIHNQPLFILLLFFFF